MCEGRNDGGFFEFGNVNLCADRRHGFQPFGCLWNSSRQLCSDPPAAAADDGEGPARSGAGVVKQGYSPAL